MYQEIKQSDEVYIRFNTGIEFINKDAHACQIACIVQDISQIDTITEK